MKKLEGKIALVTGASKGIGAAIARALGEAGASVVVNYASSKEGADRIVAEIQEQGGRAIAVQADTSKAADVERLFAESKAAYGGLDVLVNNAAVFQFDPLEELTEAEYRREFDINVLGPMLAIRESLKYFGAKGGSVINISSIASTGRAPHSVIYSATKAALDSVTRVLARELGPRNIRVNSVAPGSVDTEGTRRIGIVGSDAARAVTAQTPLGRYGRVDDIAPVVVFFASDDSAWVTGEELRVAGGFVF